MESVSYRSTQDMCKAIARSLHKIPHDIDVVVGVPRSGLLAANMVALLMNKPVVDIDSFLRWGWICRSGDRGRRNADGPVRKILVVEDSVRSGKSINMARERLRGKPYEAIYMGVFVLDGQTNKVDVYCETTGLPRVFEWNVFHHPEVLRRSCVDIDGVLCRDPTPEENDDNVNYMKFLSGVGPKIIPTIKVKTLVTCRLEKYRGITERWLDKNGVKYDNLVMMDLPDAETRRRLNRYGEFKAAEFRKDGYLLFIESSENEAKTIKRLCPEKTVLCVSTMNIIRPIGEGNDT